MAKDPYGNFTQPYDGQTTAIDTINQALSFLSRLASWEKTFITGLQLVWASASSITVKKGAAYVQTVGANSFNLVVVDADITVTGISLGNNTWGHVYLYDNSGAAAVEVVTTAPSNYFASAYQKTADTTRRYVGSVRTDGSGNIIKFTHFLNTIYYLANPATTPLRCLTAGMATSETAVDLSGVVPATARAALLNLINTADQPAYFGNADDTSSVGLRQLSPGNSVTQRDSAVLVTTTGQAVNYKMDAAVGAGGAYVDVTGYIFER